METSLKQLIPGNPGTSFVTALLYTIQQKYGKKIKNEDQLHIFTKGIVNSHSTFFSGVLNEIAKEFKLPIELLSNNNFILNLAKPEINHEYIKITYNSLNEISFENLLQKYQYVVFSVDIYQFRKYHDYHFVTISKKGNRYDVYEPKSGAILDMDQDKVHSLIKSITIGLKDSLLCFCI